MSLKGRLGLAFVRYEHLYFIPHLEIFCQREFQCFLQQEQQRKVIKISQMAQVRAEVLSSWQRYRQHALKGSLSHGCYGHKHHALKGQKLLAQGSALGIVAVSKAPCKGNSFKI